MLRRRAARLAAFALTAGPLATDVRQAFARLQGGTLLAAIPLRSSLLQAWPQECYEWLTVNISVARFAELALRIADEMPDDQEAFLLHAITAQRAARAAHAAEADTRDASGNDRKPADERSLAALTVQNADHPGRCQAQPGERLARLVTLSGITPDEVLARIFGAGQLPRQPPGA
jgi:hypothetical protein